MTRQRTKRPAPRGRRTGKRRTQRRGGLGDAVRGLLRALAGKHTTGATGGGTDHKPPGQRHAPGRDGNRYRRWDEYDPHEFDVEYRGEETGQPAADDTGHLSGR